MATIDDLYAQVVILHAKVDEMARKLKRPPSITNLTATPATLPAGGGDVTINATVKNATALTLDGVAVTLPKTVRVTASKMFTLVASGDKLPNANATVAVSVASQPSPPQPGDILVAITDSPVDAGPGDGPTWEYASKPLKAKWRNPGGDWRDRDDTPQGTNAYARATPTGIGDVSLDVAALVTRLLASNTGIYLRQEGGGLASIASRQHATLPGPRLHVVTDAGAYDPPCVVDTWINQSTATPLGDYTYFQSTTAIKFDLSGVTGTVQSATLTLNVVVVYDAAPILALYYLDPPRLFAPVDVSAASVLGIAQTVAKDNDLASHPSVLLYDDLTSLDYIGANYQGIAGKTAAQPAGTRAEIIDWPDYGLKAARLWNDGTERVISWHHWAEPKQNPPKPWQRDFGDGHTHLFLRYLCEIGDDVWDFMTSGGAKLPGMGGTYDYTSSGATTLPEPSAAHVWEGRLWHSGQSRATPYVLGGMVYLYAAEHPLSQYGGSGNNDPRNQFDGFLRTGHILCFEQEVKMNTIANGVAQADGVLRVWLWGHKIVDRADVILRGPDDRVRIQDLIWANIYQGGVGAYPTQPCHYDLGGIVVSTEYVGPPKRVTVQPPPPAQTIDSFAASKTTLAPGEPATLSWATSNAALVTLDGANVATTGSQQVTPLSSRDYTLIAEGSAAAISRTVSIAVAASPSSTLTYTKSAITLAQAYGSFHDSVTDSAGRILFAGHASHGGYGAGANYIFAYDAGADSLATLYPNNGNLQGWAATDNFVHFYIPGYNWYMQNPTVIFDLTTNTVKYSNIVAAKAAAGISDGDTTPGFAQAVKVVGWLAANQWNATTPYMAAHDWCVSQDVGIMLGSQQGSSQVATIMSKNPLYPGTPGEQPLIVKSVYMPLAARYPDNPNLGWPVRAQSNAKCVGDWLYVFGPLYKSAADGSEGPVRQNTALRLHVPTFMATPADTRVADTAVEWLPDMPVWPNGTGAVTSNCVTYDSTRGKLMIWQYKALEFDPVAETYTDVTPTGYPSVAAWNGSYSPTSQTHVLHGGYMDAANFLPLAPNTPPLSSGTPTYTTNSIAHFTFR